MSDRFTIFVTLHDRPDEEAPCVSLRFEVERGEQPRIVDATEWLENIFQAEERPFDLEGPRRAHALERLRVLAEDVELTRALIEKD
jgi:hypothetical protein